MNIIVFEDQNVDYLKPFSINHASFEMQSGVKTNLDRICDIYNHYHDNVNIVLLVRPEIENLIRFKYLTIL